MENTANTIEDRAKSLYGLLQELFANTGLELTTQCVPLFRKDAYDQALSNYGATESFPAEYRAVNGFEIVWNSKADPASTGIIKFLKVEQVLSSWEEIFYFKDIHGEDHEMRKYRPLDMPTGELSVGMFSDTGKSSSLYLLKRGNDPIPLDLDIFGYLELAIQSRGFVYWQRVLASHKQGIENEPATATMEAGMKELFPDFSMGSFLELYDSLRLSNQS